MADSFELGASANGRPLLTLKVKIDYTDNRPDYMELVAFESASMKHQKNTGGG